MGTRGDHVIFSEQKVAQMAAFFLTRRGGSMSHLKLMKLLYLADREAMARFDVPVSDDTHCSMNKGPVLSYTLDLMKGVRQHPAWSALISPLDNNNLHLVKNITALDELDELSRADLNVLESVYQAYGHKNRWDLVDLTHTFPEWNDPGRSSTPIDQTLTFQSFGCSEEQAREKAQSIQLRKQLGRKLSEMY